MEFLFSCYVQLDALTREISSLNTRRESGQDGAILPARDSLALSGMQENVDEHCVSFQKLNCQKKGFILGCNTHQ